MLEVSKIRINAQSIIEQLKKRGADHTKNIKLILDLDQKRIANQQRLDSLLSEGNQIAKKIGELAKEKKFNEINTLKEQAASIKNKSKLFHQTAKDLEISIQEVLVKIPNTPHNQTPNGNSAEDNIITYEWGKKTNNDKIIPHWEVAEKSKIIDFQKGAEITGSGFPIYIGKGAQLQRALINFFLDYNSQAGYTEYAPPYFVNENSAFNTGQIPDKEGMMYHITSDDLYVIPTAEVPITNIFKNTRLKDSDLPLKCTAYSPCFRREAGSYGKDVRGLNRLHQFDKVEIVQIATQIQSYTILESMVEHVSNLLKQLNLQFRILKLCGGDLGFTSALTYDFEVYAPGQEKWLEVSSVSNFEAYQANRLNLKYTDCDGNRLLCHTLNGSSLALPRIMVGLLEQHQYENSVLIPEKIQKYLPFDKIIIPS